jgi:lipoprotein-anchoring transpeptidase ErfK/SrfK
MSAASSRKRLAAILGFALAGLSPAWAGSALVDAMVIPGDVPDAAVYNTPQAGRQVRVASSQGGYGGGFIEMLMNGGSPSPMPSSVLYNQPPSQPQPARPSASSYSAYAQPQQAYEPRRTIDPQFMKSEVEYDTAERPGTIVIDTASKHLYLVAGQGHALRYGIGVGRPGFMWAGTKTITRKAEWPDWTPPSEMLLRRPDLPRHMDGGPENPLGARAMYLGSSLYRIHGTNEPYTIGQNVSSGCIRMMNEDVIDLYNRVGVGTKVIVM